MNNVALMGRLVRDPEVRYTQGEKPTCVASFTLAVSRLTKDKTADFIRCKALGKTAEIVEKYCAKGKMLGVVGSIRTEEYTNKEGKKTWSVEVFTDRVELISTKSDSESSGEKSSQIPTGFSRLEDDMDIPF